MRTFILIAVLLFSVFVNSANAERGERAHTGQLPQGRNQIENGPKIQPPNSIRIAVRYKKEYGYQSEHGVFDPGPNSCGAFSVSVTPDTNDRRRDPIRITIEPKMRDTGGFYICDYLAEDLPLTEPIRVSVGMADSRTALVESWKGGAESTPPRGYRRTIPNGTTYLTLTESSSRASQVYEMIYDLPPLKGPIRQP